MPVAKVWVSRPSLGSSPELPRVFYKGIAVSLSPSLPSFVAMLLRRVRLAVMAKVAVPE